MDTDVVLWIVVGDGARVRLHQRLPRHRERGRDSISTRAMPPRVAVTLAAILNFVGAFLSLAVAATIATGIVDADLDHADDRLRRPDRRDRLEPADLVLRAAVVVLARADRRRRRRDARRRRARRPCYGAGLRRQGHRPGAGRAGAGASSSAGLGDPDRLPDRRPPAARARHARLPARPARLRQPVLALARHQRRAEDDGHHLPRAGRQREPVARTPTSRPGSSCPRRPRSRSAPTSAAGGSSARWAAGSSRWTRRRASRPRASGAAVILSASHVGFPLSTTHVISGAIMGAGAAKRALRGALGRGRATSSSRGC